VIGARIAVTQRTRKFKKKAGQMKEPDYSGRIGKAWKLDFSVIEKRRPEHAANLACWLLHVPRAHPLWPQYVLSLIHLRDVPCQAKPPYLRMPNASHELQLLALNVPEFGPFTFENWPDQVQKHGWFLLPTNAVEQVAHLNDEKALHLTKLVAKACVDGLLPVELDDYRGRYGSGQNAWRVTLDHTCEHLIAGGHYGKPN
jgi:hypothetical protein